MSGHYAKRDSTEHYGAYISTRAEHSHIVLTRKIGCDFVSYRLHPF